MTDCISSLASFPCMQNLLMGSFTASNDLLTGQQEALRHSLMTAEIQDYVFQPP